MTGKKLWYIVSYICNPLVIIMERILLKTTLLDSSINGGVCFKHLRQLQLIFDFYKALILIDVNRF